jgi:hypothetical protein
VAVVIQVEQAELAVAEQAEQLAEIQEALTRVELVAEQGHLKLGVTVDQVQLF